MKNLYISLLLLCSNICYLQASDYLNLSTIDPYTSIIAEDNQLISLGFDTNDLEISEIVKGNTTFDACTIPGEGITFDYGKPILPAISRFVVVPPNSGLELVVEAGEPRIVKASNPPEVWDDEDMLGYNQVAPPDNEIYPSVIAEMSEPIVIRGVRLVKVTTYPVRYDQSSDSYLHYDHIQTEIRFNNEEAVNPASHPNRRYRSSQFLKFIEALAINGENIRRDEPIDEMPPYVGHYLIVTHEACLEYAAPFIEWRRKSGYKVDILSLSSGDANNPAAVKEAIQDYYDMYLDDGIDPFDYILMIGDRSSYSYGPAPNWILNANTGTTNWGGAPHADYLYACLEGRDEIPDVGFARWMAGSQSTLELAVGRTLGYEATPFIDDLEWFGRSVVFSHHWGNSEQSEWHPSVHLTVRWGLELLQQKGFENIQHYEYFPWDQQGNRIGPWLGERINEGTNVMIGLTSLNYWRQNFQGVDDNSVFPIFLSAGNHGDLSSPSMFRTGDGDHLKGPVAMCFTAGELGTRNSVVPNSFIWMEMVRAFLVEDLSLGWARTSALIAFEGDMPDMQIWGHDVYPMYKTDFDVIGDPGLQPWIGVPTAVDIDFPEHISPEARALTVHVTNHEDNEDLMGAQVTIYNPGDMPDPDSDDYAEYDEMFMMTTTTNEWGTASFVFPEDSELELGTMYVTVSGRDVCPEFGEIAIEQSNLELGISRYSLMEIVGNDDDDVNPGESFFMLLYAKNLGSEDTAEDVTAELSTNSPWIEDFGDNIGFDDIEPGDEVIGWGGVEINISPSCPDAASRPLTNPVIDIILTNGDETWYSAIKLNPVAPNLEVSEIIGDEIIGLDQTEIDIELENVGGMDIGAFNAELVALEYGISVTRRNGDYLEIDAGETSTLDSDPFVVIGSALTIPGTRVEMALILSNEDDFVDTAYFELQVREPEENVPTGPDDYGYSCFDDTDTDWLLVPEYDWIEICPDEDDADFEGTLIDFDGHSENDIGEAMVIDLGYTLVFYGQEYDQITVATNGFICVGEQELIVNFENWPLDRCIGGGMGMIAPFWDDLRLNDGGVYYFHDEDNGRFIVEWYDLRHAVGNDELTFQVVLFDGEIYPTVSGDHKILFQYQSIDNTRNIRNGDQEWYDNIPFASVGISSPDGTTGINYTWNNEYPISAAQLEPERALLFTTSIFESWDGFLSGTVTNAFDNEPLEDVTVISRFNQIATTDADGYWEIPDAITGYEFDLRFTLQGYNDSVVSELFLEEDEELSVDVALLHPEFEPSQWSFVSYLEPDQTVEIDFTVENTGNGPLDWELKRQLPWGADADPWEHRVSYAVSDSVGDARVEGVVFADDRFYVSGSNILDGDDGENMIYVLDRDGHEVNRFTQSGDSRYGMRDLAWDGELIWGCSDELIIGFTTDGDSITSFEGPDGALNVIAWDPEREVLWVARKTGRAIYALTREGEEVFSIPRFDFRLTGLAYWKDAPDDYKLFIYHSPDNEIGVVHKVNPENGDTTFVRILEHEAGGSPRGAFCTNQYDVYSWVFMCISDNADHDRIDIWQLDARRDWFRVFTELDPDIPAEHGRIDARETKDFTLRLSSDDLPPEVEFNGFLVFKHDTTGRPSDTLDVLLDVVGERRQTDFSLLYPANGDTLPENPSNDTTMVTFAWEQSVDYNADDHVTYTAFFSAGDDTVSIECEDATSLDIEAIDLASEFNLPIETEWQLDWWVISYSGVDTVPCTENFTVRFMPDAILDSGDNIPVEFGLQSIHPSPFNAVTTISFGIDVNERAKLQIYDLTGRRVATLFDGNPAVGYHSIAWNASSFPSGLYFVRLESMNRVQTAKVALIR
jgi:hypothetical protein